LDSPEQKNKRPAGAYLGVWIFVCLCFGDGMAGFLAGYKGQFLKSEK
jgi:hypothetical protein